MDFRTAFDAERLADYQKGVMAYAYRGVPCHKSPLDLAIYLRVLWELKPASIIEVGTRHGGSALWFADMAQVMGLGAEVVAVDLQPPAGGWIRGCGSWRATSTRSRRR